MEDNAGRYVVHNGTVKESSDALGFDMGKVSGRAAYEVIRIINGVPLFFEDHYSRLETTFAKMGKPLNMTMEQLSDSIRKLLSKTSEANCNIKFVLFDESEVQQQLVYISESYYPTDAEANAGVITGTLQIERHNPNAKILDKTYKDAVNAKKVQGGFFEVILVDSAGRITEGSKSNLFFVRNDKILTAPGEYVLKGITRKYVFEACQKAGYEVSEAFVGVDEISQMDGAFLSGTSIKVLPVKSIDNIVMNSSTNPVINAVRREYDRILGEYIEKHVNIW
jgi:branched-chain amino acid aminotransferase